MTILKSESQNATSLYVVKSIRENGKRTSKIVEKLGTVAELEKNSAGVIHTNGRGNMRKS